jgi:hypothetical protein
MYLQLICDITVQWNGYIQWKEIKSFTKKLVDCVVLRARYTRRRKVYCDYLHLYISQTAVGKANRYGLDGQRIESLWERDILHPSKPALAPTQAPIQWVPGLISGGKAAGAWL